MSNPIYRVSIVGDLEVYASALPTTISANYNSLTDMTEIIAEATNKDHSYEVYWQYRRLHSELLKDKNADQVKVLYMKSGLF